jgi:hypothetical protein
LDFRIVLLLNSKIIAFFNLFFLLYYLMIHMKILLSNDDGVDASGILAAKEVADEFGETFVVAPSKQQSGIGHALTLFKPLRVNEVNLRDGDVGYGVSGTPTDAVTLAVYELMDEIPDLVVSGINTGRNVGKGELTTSGTLGAASEAASYGIPTIAVSQHVTDDDITSTAEAILAQIVGDDYISIGEKVRVVDYCLNSMTKLGAIQPMIDDRSITEIMVNGPDNIFYEKAGRLYKSDTHFDNEKQLEDVIQKIVSKVNRTVDSANPI